MRQGSAAHDQKLERVVEAGGVALVFTDDREELFDVFAEELGGEAAFTRPHPIDVSLQCIDLAVMADIAVGVGQRPRWKGIGREAGVDQRQGAHDLRIGEIGIEKWNLRGEEEPLVNDRVA
ncbi:MAG: hypothetical protein MPW13_15275 [Candidatus Manganitrophus sp.]|nr:hypothetical protein [Candidatus Manganitrophus sp.]